MKILPLHSLIRIFIIWTHLKHIVGIQTHPTVSIWSYKVQLNSLTKHGVHTTIIQFLIKQPELKAFCVCVRGCNCIRLSVRSCAHVCSIINRTIIKLTHHSNIETMYREYAIQHNVLIWPPPPVFQLYDSISWVHIEQEFLLCSGYTTSLPYMYSSSWQTDIFFWTADCTHSIGISRFLNSYKIT